MQRRERLDLVAEEFDPDRVLFVHREDLEGVAAHPEGAAGAGQIVARVLDVDQRPQQFVAVALFADPQPDHAVDVLLRGAQAVDGRHGGDHDHVAPGQQRAGGRVPQPLDLFVERGVLLDVGVGLRHVRLGLVIVVVGDEVLDRVVGEERAQLVGELSRERLVGLHHQHRTLQPLGQPGHGRGLAGAGGAEHHHVALARGDPVLQGVDRRRLVTGGDEVGLDLERCHPALQVGCRTHDRKRRRPRRQFPIGPPRPAGRRRPVRRSRVEPGMTGWPASVLPANAGSPAPDASHDAVRPATGCSAASSSWSGSRPGRTPRCSAPARSAST